jgi:hypothetical protein
MFNFFSREISTLLSSDSKIECTGNTDEKAEEISSLVQFS